MFKYLIAFYSLVVSTVLFIGSIFFLPKPQAYATGVLFLPVVIFLWVRATSPERVDSVRWSSRLLAGVAITGALGVLALWLSNLAISKNREPEMQETPVANTSYDEILSRLDSIEKSIDKLSETGQKDSVKGISSEEIDKILEENSDSPTKSGSVKLPN